MDYYAGQISEDLIQNERLNKQMKNRVAKFEKYMGKR